MPKNDAENITLAGLYKHGFKITGIALVIIIMYEVGGLIPGVVAGSSAFILASNYPHSTIWRFAAYAVIYLLAFIIASFCLGTGYDLRV